MNRFVYGFFFFLAAILFFGDGKMNVVDVVGAVGVIGLYFFTALYEKKQREIPTQLLVSWTLFLLYLALRTVFSGDVGLSIYATVRMIDAFLVFFIFYRYSKPSAVTVIMKNTIYFSIFAFVCSVIFSLIPFLSNTQPQMNLLLPSFGHNRVVDILLFSAPIALALWLQTQRRTYLLLFGLLCLGGFYSFGRAAQIYLLFMTLGSIFVIKRIPKTQKRTLIILVLMLFIATATTLWIAARPEGPGSTTIAQHIKTNKQPLQQDGRIEYWRQAIAAFQTRPIFGGGPGTFFLLSKQFQKTVNSYSWFAHNFLLEQLAELGIVGVALIGFLLFSCAKEIYSGIKRKPVYPVYKDRQQNILPLVGGLAVVFLYGCVDYTFNYLLVWLLWWALMGVCCGMVSEKNTVHNRKEPLTFSASVLTLFLFYIYIAWGGISFYITDQKKVQTCNAFSLISANESIRCIDEWKGTDKEFDRFIQKVVLFHKSNAEVLWSIGKKYNEFKKIDKTRAYYDLSINLAPKETQNIFSYCFFYLSQKDSSVIKKPLYALGLSGFLDPQTTDIIAHVLFDKNAPQYKKTISLIEELPEVRYINDWSAKMYYYLGFILLQSDPNTARQLWKMAADTKTWAYYYLELASVEKYVLNDKKAATKTLQACIPELFDSFYCAYTPIEALPAPGFFEPKIALTPVKP